MSITSKLLAGLVKGLGGPDLDNLLDDITKKAGEQIGTIIKAIVRQSGTELQESEKKLDQWIRENPQQIPVITSAVVDKAIRTTANGKESLLPDYLIALGMITSTISQTKMSVYLRGFLHSDKCGSYWHLDPYIKKGLIANFKEEANRNLISAPNRPEVFIVDHEPSDDEIRNLNLKIRQHPQKILETSDYSRLKRVRTIREFKVEYGGIPADDTIPLGAHGIIAMIESLGTAMEAQDKPAEMLEKTLAEAKLNTR